ncbi:hypothetical protein [Gracilibacillus salinarum]|uniref:Uncharacterized protein n=1 Tax=Gracilibacillus salinarum TaxID=2932255 RepID=A0ABY4GH55_9BACI|nr:hypothetical protein [Gracilibacillus salinarum]UOQ83663.1 hypothetical protein MUN87_12950 [Gracilibacillus salinarum]
MLTEEDKNMIQLLTHIKTLHQKAYDGDDASGNALHQLYWKPHEVISPTMHC